MIISHKYKFIFIKTYKTAGSSIEAYLSEYCSGEDILTPVWPDVENHEARNYRGLWNPVPDLLEKNGQKLKTKLLKIMQAKKFYNHIPAVTVRRRVPDLIWNSYFKFCVERNPWDKTISHFSMLNSMSGGRISIDEYFLKRNFPINHPLYCNSKGNVMVDRVIYYENLDEGLAEVFGKKCIPFNGALGVHAKSNYRKDKRPYQELYAPFHKKLVEQYFHKEIEMHRYTFE